MDVYTMLLKLMLGCFMCICCGCYTFPLWTPSCSHTDQVAYQFKDFEDGHHFVFQDEHHFVFRGNTKLAASINTKDGYPQGKFEIYYDTGVLKYWGMLDVRGHVVSGAYNKRESGLSLFSKRRMTMADRQNAQTELCDIMRKGFQKTNVIQTNADVIRSEDAIRDEKSESKLLLDCLNTAYHPSVGDVYQHDGKGLKVCRVIDGAVIVMVETSSISDMLNSSIIRIDTKIPYVDDEILRAGHYEYVGPYTYEWVRTIRRFKQVK